MNSILISGIITVLTVSCGNNSYQRKPLPDRVITVPARDDNYNQDNSSDLEQSNPGDDKEKDYSDIIKNIIKDDAKTKQLAQDVVRQLKTFEPKIDVNDQYIEGLVTLIKAKSPQSPEDITEAVYPAVRELFNSDPDLSDSPVKELVLNAEDMVKSQITTKIEETLSEESL